jgi:hypothetical protein
MKNIDRDLQKNHRLRLSALALASTLALAACGGGGGNPGNTGTATGTTPATGTAPVVTTPTAPVVVGAPSSIALVTAVPSDKSIVIKGEGGNGRTETATLTFKVLDTNNNPLAGQKVNFSTASKDVVLNTASGTTDSAGLVVATVNSGTKPTSFSVKATVDGRTDISTGSDSILVTTGLATQRSFSISTTVYNPEAWTFDSSPTTPAAKIQILLADAFGNPVSDGTPITTQTNAGSVGSSNSGGCLTVNGGCTVDFRAQNPRVPTPGLPKTACNTYGSDGLGKGIRPDVDRPGVATICASSTNNLTTYFDSIPIFLSGSTVEYLYLNSINNPIDLNGERDMTKLLKLDTVAIGVPVTFSLQLNDINHNPMPAGSKVTVENLTNATAGAVIPATVSNAGLNSIFVQDPQGAIGSSQGTWHRFTITPTTAGCPGTNKDVTFSVQVVTPGETASAATGATTTTISFGLSLTCP